MSFCIWITGLSGSGKSTIGRAVYEQLKSKGTPVVFLDGDDFRKIIGSVNAHTRDQRLKVAMQISRMCKFLTQQEINVVCCTISLFNEIHEFNRANIANYIEVYIACEMSELVERDQKGLYSGALSGKIRNVVGIDIPYDKPESCNLIIDNTKTGNSSEKASRIIEVLNNKLV